MRYVHSVFLIYLFPSAALMAVLATATCFAFDGSSLLMAWNAEPSKRPAVPVIFDTDMDTDCDDIGALAVLHALADRGETKILATGVSSKHAWSAPCLDALNTFYGRPRIPIGVPKGPGAKHASKYARQIAQEFPHDLRSPVKAPEAAQLYREVLSKQPDKSVVIITVGYLTNMAALLKLPAQGDYPSGLEIVRSKVKMWVCMGGNFVGRPAKDDLRLGNNNFTYDKVAAHHAVSRWPTPLTFVGREIGSVPSGLRVGARLKQLQRKNPVRRGYELWFGGQPRDRHVADQTTVLFAIRGLRDYWKSETKGYMDLQPDMTFQWRYDKDKQHSYLLKRKVKGQPNDRYIERTIENLMLQAPRPGQNKKPER